MNCRYMDLNQKVFGNITVKEIIGGMPTKIEIEQKFIQELEILLQKLNKKEEVELKILSDNQKKLEREVNSRPGAMALAQEKISLFVEYSNRYLEAIERRLNNKIE